MLITSDTIPPGSAITESLIDYYRVQNGGTRSAAIAAMRNIETGVTAPSSAQILNPNYTNLITAYEQSVGPNFDQKVNGVETLDGTVFTINGVEARVEQKDTLGSITVCSGTTVPTDGSTGYAKGCIFRDTDVASAYSGNYENLGTTTSSLFARSVTPSVATAVVGFSNADYIADGVADDVTIQAAITAVSAAGGGKVLLKRGTYNTIAAITLPTKVEIVGEEKASTIVKLGANRNVSVFTNGDSTTGTPFITLRNFTVDQNGANQTSAGGGFAGTYITDLLLEDMIFNTSYNFNFLFLAQAGTALAGTHTFTVNSAALAGSGTDYLTTLAPGTIVKSAGGEFARVLSVTSDTAAVLEAPWGFPTEAAVAAKTVPGNARNRMKKCLFNGSLNTDNAGFGLFVDSTFEDCISRSSGGGYGYGPDHCFNTKFINCSALDNNNSGFGAETCYSCTFMGNQARRNGVDGIAMVSGSRNNVITGNICTENTRGIQLTFNSGSFPRPDWNIVSGNICDNNTSHGIRLGGAIRCSVTDNICRNNGQGGAAAGGIALASDTATDPQRNLISGNMCYDTQAVKTQGYGIWIDAGTNNVIENNYTPNVDNLTAGILDSGTLNLKRNNFGVNPEIAYAQGNVTGATTFNRVNGDLITATLTGDITVTLTAPSSAGDRLSLILTQDGTGSRLVTWPGNFLKAGGALVLSVGAAAVDQIHMEYDGTNWVELSRAIAVA